MRSVQARATTTFTEAKIKQKATPNGVRMHPLKASTLPVVRNRKLGMRLSGCLLHVAVDMVSTWTGLGSNVKAPNQ